MVKNLYYVRMNKRFFGRGGLQTPPIFCFRKKLQYNNLFVIVIFFIKCVYTELMIMLMLILTKIIAVAVNILQL